MVCIYNNIICIYLKYCAISLSKYVVILYYTYTDALKSGLIFLKIKH